MASGLSNRLCASMVAPVSTRPFAFPLRLVVTRAGLWGKQGYEDVTNLINAKEASEKLKIPVVKGDK